MNDSKETIEATEDQLVAGVEGVMKVAGLYADSINVIQDAMNLSDKAFEDVGSSSQGDWEEYCNAIWGFLAKSQDSVSGRAKMLAEYTAEIFDVDGANADKLNDAGDLEKAEKPNGG